MDLLHLYESSSSDNDNDDDNKDEQDGQPHDANAPNTDTSDTKLADSHYKKQKIGTVTIVADRDLSPQQKSLFVRSQPHVRGNWAGHLYAAVTLSATDYQTTADEAVQTFSRDLERAGWSGTLVQHAAIHLSLARPFYLQTSCIDSFVDKLQRCLATCPACTVRCVANPLLLVNDTGQRSFLTWPVQASASLQTIVQHMDRVLVEYNQAVYYQPASFHVSLASFAGAESSLLQPTQPKVATTAWFPIHVDRIQCTLGTTKSFTIPLQAF